MLHPSLVRIPAYLEDPFPNDKIESPPPFLTVCREAFIRFRYAMLWFPSRGRGVAEPLAALAVGAWLAYGSWEKAVAHQTAAICMASSLGFSFLVHAASLSAGLAFGGPYRALFEGLSWPFVQKLEMLGPFLHSAVLSHWSRLIGRSGSVPAWAFVFLTGLRNSISSSLCDPLHVLVLRLLILAHHCAVFAYSVMTTPGAGPHSWVEQALVAAQLAMMFVVSHVGAGRRGEAVRLRDLQVHAQATLQRDVTLALVTNFVPPAVLRHVRERASAGDASDIIAWKFDPGCVLQSDIVGFTSLGAHITPEQLCRLRVRHAHFVFSVPLLPT